MKLIYSDHFDKSEFKVIDASADAEIKEELLKEFAKYYNEEITNYDILKEEQTKLTKARKELLVTLKYNFTKFIENEHPEYLL